MYFLVVFECVCFVGILNFVIDVHDAACEREGLWLCCVCVSFIFKNNLKHCKGKSKAL